MKEADLYFVFNVKEEETEVKINVQEVGKVKEWDVLNSIISEVESTQVSKNQIRFDVKLGIWETKVFVVGK